MGGWGLVALFVSWVVAAINLPHCNALCDSLGMQKHSRFQEGASAMNRAMATGEDMYVTM